MKVACQKCYKDIDLNPFQKGELEKQLTCTHCGAFYTVRPRIGTDKLDIVFGQGNRVVRTCINCSKKFYCLPADPIPVCPSCKSAPPAKEKEINKYFIIKETGKKVGPYALEELGNWIKDGLLGENDIIETSEGDQLKAYKLLELNPYFKNFYSKTRKIVQPVSAKVHSKVRHQLHVPFGKILFLLIISTVAIWAYLVFRGSGNETTQINRTMLLKNNWSENFNKLPKSYEFYHEAGLTELKIHTEASCLQARNNFIKAYIKKDGFVPELPHMALALSCLYAYNAEPKTIKSALEINKLALESSTPITEAFMAEGDIMLKLGKLEESRLALNKALEITPNNAFLFFLLGKNFLQTPGKKDQGIEYLLKSLKLDPTLSYVNMILGLNAYKDENFGVAIEYFNKRLQKSTHDSEALYYRAQTYIKLKRYNEAKLDLERSIKNNRSLRARLLLAKLLFKIYRQFSESARNTKITLAQEERLTRVEAIDAHLLLSHVYLRNKEYEKALTESDKGLSIKPTDHFLKLAKINALLSLKRKDEAQPIVQGFMISEAFLKEDVTLHLLKTFERHNLDGEKFDLLLKYALGKPKTLYPFLKLAAIYVKNSDGEKAKNTLLTGMDKTILFQQNEFLPNLRASHLNIDIRKVGQALKKVSQNNMNLDLIDTSIAIAKLQGDPDRLKPPNLRSAKNILNSIIRKDKNIVHTYLGLTFINIITKNTTKARDFLKKVSEMDIKSSSMNVAQGILYNMSGEKAKARAKLKEAINNDWIKFLVLFELGNVELSSGNRDDAYLQYRKSYSAQKNFYPAIEKMAKLERAK